MKKLFIAAIILMFGITVAVFGARSVFGTIEEEGYIVPSSAGVSQALAGEGSVPISLVPVTYDDVVYSTLTGYFVGEDREKVDLTYPLFTKGGTGVRFLGEDNWMITTDVDLYQTFDGLYVSEGISYNRDMTQADDEEFILLALSNGLYMNAQQAVFQGPLGSVVIPANSILSMTEENISWYGQSHGCLAYAKEDAVFDATMTFGSHEYEYKNLLDALGLVRTAIDRDKGERPDEELLEEAEEILNGKENDKAGSGDRETAEGTSGESGETAPGTGTGAPGEAGDSPIGENGAPSGSGSAPVGSGSEGDSKGTDGEKKDKDKEDKDGEEDEEDSEDKEEKEDKDKNKNGKADGKNKDNNNSDDPASGSSDKGKEEADGKGEGEGDDDDLDEELDDSLLEEEEKGEGDRNDPNSGSTSGSEAGFGGEMGGGEGSASDNNSGAAGGESSDSGGGSSAGSSAPSGGSGSQSGGSGSSSNSGAGAGGSNTGGNSSNNNTAGGSGQSGSSNSGESGDNSSNSNNGNNDGVDKNENENEKEDDTENKDPDSDNKDDNDSNNKDDGNKDDDNNKDDDEGDNSDEGGGNGSGNSGEKPPEKGDEDIEEGKGEGENKAPNQKFEYKVPAVTLKKLEPWSYAVNIGLSSDDQSGVIIRGVSFSVYEEIKGDNALATEEEIGDLKGLSGVTFYSAKSNEGKSTVLRRSKNGSQEFALSTLEPGQIVYIQYNYRYHSDPKEEPVMELVTEIVKDAEGNPVLDKDGNPVTKPVYDEDGKLVYKEALDENGKPLMKVVYHAKERVYSPLIRVEVPGTAGNVTPIGSNWTTSFAAKDHAMEIQGLTLFNTSNYDPEKQSYSFENFKLNTLPYVNRLEFILTPKGSTDANKKSTISVSSKTLAEAQKEGGTSYTSSSPSLESNTEYSYTVVARDRWGNEVPLKANGVDSKQFSGIIHTRKTAPTVTIEEVTNVTDILTLRLTITDKDGALMLDDSHALTMKIRDNKLGIYAELYGNWDESSISKGGDGVQELILKDPEHGKVYELTLGSLAFSRLYDVEIWGSYDPQPTVAASPVLAKEENKILSRQSVYTASLSSGMIGINSSITNLKDTYATLNFTMNKNTTLDILPMVDEYRIKIKDKSGKEIQRASVTLKESELNQFPYDENKHPYDEATAELLVAETEMGLPRVTLYGSREQIRKNPWEAFSIAMKEQTDGSTKVEYTTPMDLRVMLQEGTLVNNTDYTFTIEAVVKKSGHEYQIPVKMNINSFTTKKIQPKILYQDFFLAGENAEFIDLWIYDPDGTIQNNGAVRIELLDGDTRLALKNITASKQELDKGENIRFEGLTPGKTYTVKFIAGGFNDAEGYGSYQTNYLLRQFNIVAGSSLSGSLGLKELDDQVNLVDFSEDWYQQAYMDQKTAAYPAAMNQSKYRTYFIPCKPDTEYEIQAPRQTQFIRIACTNVDDPRVYDTNNKVQLKSFLHEKTYKYATYKTTSDAKWIVISMGNGTYGITEEEYRFSFRVTEVAVLGDFDASIEVQIQDAKGYLMNSDGKVMADLTVYRSDSMEIPDYEVYETRSLELEQQEDGSYAYDAIQELKELPPNNGWKVTLTAEYLNVPVEMDRLVFRTDDRYVLVSTHEEMVDAMYANPYANILVVSDFEQNVNSVPDFYGIIDFQGHVVTRDPNITKSFLNVYMGAKVMNLVYDYPHEPAYTSRYTIFNTVYGEIENLMVRTYGRIDAKSQLCGGTFYASSSLRNFIIKLGGDLELNEGGAVGAIFGTSYGVIKNGYMYSSNNAGILFRRGNAAMLRYTYGTSIMKNFYVAMDTWYQTDSNAIMMGYDSSNYPRFSDAYVVGDFYSLREGEGKSWGTATQNNRVTMQTGRSTNFDNVWTMSSRSYVMPNYNSLQSATVDKLSDVEWQKSIMGNAFDVEGTVPLGFYPRLNLPNEMMVHQEYISLPAVISASVPKLLSDEWIDDEDQTATSGTVRLVFKNDQNSPIEEIIADSLEFKINEQQATSDGLYEVIAEVKIDEKHKSPVYASRYTISEFVYSASGTKRSEYPNYKTSSIEFWKEIYNINDWSSINSGMSQNYRLMSDLDFTGSNINAINIDGKTSVLSNTTSFTGKIDGQEHVLKNISIQGTAYPYLFYNLNPGAELRNIFVENMTLVGTSKSGEAAGFIRSATGALLENIRIRGSFVQSGSKIGTLIGNTASTRIYNCSVVDSTVDDIDNGYLLFAGGMVGYNNANILDGCYIRNVNVVVDNSVIVDGAGGISGHSTSDTITRNCYAYGSINAVGNRIGGISGGESGGYVMNCWSYVNIFQSGGDNACGVGMAATMNNLIALGNITSSAENVERLRITTTTLTDQTRFAYAGQVVSGIAEGELGNAVTRLLSGQELSIVTTWQDVIALGTAWDYSPISQGNLPLLQTDVSDAEKADWRQQHIPLPGLSGDPSLKVMQAIYNSSDPYPYSVQVRLEHPTLSHEQLKALYVTAEDIEKDPSKQKNMLISIDGINLDDATLKSGDATISLDADTTAENATFITIRVKLEAIYKALDNYILDVSYREPIGESGAFKDRSLNVLVEYMDNGQPHRRYWSISNLAEWNDLMMRDGGIHQRSGENVRITGIVDFGGNNTPYYNLNFNRLEGAVTRASESVGIINADVTVDCTAQYGFKGLSYISDEDGSPWIEKVGMDMTGLIFEDMDFNFQNTKTRRVMTGAFIGINKASNMKLTDITMTVNDNSSTQVGFIANAVEIDTVVMHTFVGQNTINSTAKTTAGSLNGLCVSLRNIDASDITLNFPIQNDLGGITGSKYDIKYSLENINIDGFEITGGSRVGSISAYYAGLQGTRNLIAQNGTIKGSKNVGGIIGAYGVYQSNVNNLLAKKLTVTATAGMAGGISGTSAHSIYKNVKVEDCAITAATAAGGLTGGGSGHGLRNYDNIEIVGCTITSEVSVDTTQPAAGGLAGWFDHENYNAKISGVVIRDCDITGVDNVGGFAGHFSANQTVGYIRRVYVAEDVTVTASGNSAGGIFGWTSRANLTDCASGATVSAKDVAGGIIGTVDLYNGDLFCNIKNVYYHGTVSASGDYAGGLIAKFNHNQLKLTEDQVDNNLVIADVRSNGANASLWINDTSPTGTAGKVGVFICEDSLLNGQSAKDLLATSLKINAAPTVVPTPSQEGDPWTSRLIPAARFAEEELYTEMEFGTSWSVSHLSTEGNRFMPYTKNSDNSALLPTVNTYENETVGIPLPLAGAAIENKTAIYTSGINSINIEVPVIVEPSDPTDPTEPEAGDTDTSTQAEGDTDSGSEENGSDSTVATIVAVTFTKEGEEPITQEYVPDDNGVISLYYDFESDVTVTIGEVSVTVEASELSRKVMTQGTDSANWYYIEKNTNAIRYGDASGTSTVNMYMKMEEASSGTDNDSSDGSGDSSDGSSDSSDGSSDSSGGGSGSSGESSKNPIPAAVKGFDADENPIHLWQGKVLTDKGKVYSLSGGSATAVENTVEAKDLFTQLDKSVPFWKDSNVAVYHNFTLYGSEEIEIPDLRVFVLADFQGYKTPYPISPAQKTLYDGLILNTVIPSDPIFYFALLGEDGNLVDHRGTMKIGNLPQNIKYISNNFGYSGGTVLLAYYENGDVYGINYSDGSIFLKPASARTFGAYIKQYMNALLPSFSGSSDMPVGGFLNSVGLQGDLINDGSIKPSTTGATPEDGKGESGKATGGETPTGTAEDPKQNAAADAEGIAAEGTAKPEGGSSDQLGSGSGQESVLETIETEHTNGSSPDSGSNLASGEGDATDDDGSGNGEAVGSSEESGSDEESSEEDSMEGALAEGVGAEAEGDGTEAEASEGSDEEESGSASGDNDGESSEAQGDGVRNDNEPGDGVASSGAAQNSDISVLQQLFGDSIVAYSPQTGQYELMDTASLLSGDPMTVEEALAEKEKAEAEKEEDDEKDDEIVLDNKEQRPFNVAWNLNRNLYSVEKQGFMLIGMAAAVGVIILFVLYWKVIRKNKRRR